MADALVSIVGVEDTANGPRDLGSVDGDEVTISVTVDGELTVSNGRGGFFGGPFTYGLDDLTDGKELSSTMRLELRIIYPEEG